MATQTVAIQAMKFNPATIEIQAGDSVRWKNEMGMTHTSTSDDGTSWDTGDIAANTTSAAQTLSVKGTYPYHCSIHPFMKGTVVVKWVNARYCTGARRIRANDSRSLNPQVNFSISEKPMVWPFWRRISSAVMG